MPVLHGITKEKEVSICFLLGKKVRQCQEHSQTQAAMVSWEARGARAPQVSDQNRQSLAPDSSHVHSGLSFLKQQDTSEELARKVIYLIKQLKVS